MTAKDLSLEPPRSPHVRIHDYVILARTLDKCRAHLQGTSGDYHFNSSLDQILFEFKCVSACAFMDQVRAGATDEEMGHWLDSNGNVQTPGSISEWSASLAADRPYENPERRQWFVEKCAPLGLNPQTTTLFGYLEADDKASFPHSARSATDPNNWDIPLVETAPENHPSSLKATMHG